MKSREKLTRSSKSTHGIVNNKRICRNATSKINHSSQAQKSKYNTPTTRHDINAYLNMAVVLLPQGPAAPTAPEEDLGKPPLLLLTAASINVRIVRKFSLIWREHEENIASQVHTTLQLSKELEI